jgi:antitoxin component of RelBE/YafQ-DinJ toxin-antitoxin module
MKRDVILQIRVSEEEKESMRKIAEEKHITVSGLIRTAILSPQR